MTKYLIRRLIGTIPVLFLITFFVFALLHAAPGDPASLLLPSDATAADVADARRVWGLDEPFYVQYLKFFMNALRGDLGQSFRSRQPVLDLIGQRLPATLELALFAAVIASAIAIPLGVLAGARPNSAIDNVGTVFGLFGISMPSFWFGIMMILLFSGILHALPSSGRSEYGVAGESITGFYVFDSILHGNFSGVIDAIVHMIMPALALGTALAGIQMRITRSAVLEITREVYVTAARAKGLSDRVILSIHVFRNALIPIVTVVGLELGTLLSGSIIVETVFSWPGVGSLLISGVSSRDYPLVTGIVLVYSAAFVLINLVVDLIYALADPRIRLG
jgi:ABC-type dipeptide/oligopeptide/nickel transport system permease component